MNRIETAAVLSDGRTVQRVILENAAGTRVCLLSLGCVIESVETADRNGNPGNIVMCWPRVEDYLDNPACIGALVGRTAGRTAGGRFEIDGETVQLEVNSGPNSIHGGLKGFHRCLWEPAFDGETAVLRLFSPHGDGGYPGNLTMEARFTLTEDNRLIQELRAESDRKTWLNPTNHSYFNLSAGEDGHIGSHVLTIDSKQWHPVDADGLPQEAWCSVEGSPFDLRAGAVLGQVIDAGHPQLRQCLGLDHPFRLEPGNTGIRLWHPGSGRVLAVETDCPAVVVYSGNYLGEAEASDGSLPFCPRQGICLETQELPDAVNRSDENVRWLMPGIPWMTRTVFRFGVQ